MSAVSVDVAAKLAAVAFTQLRDVSDETRGQWLRAIAQAIDSAADELVDLAIGETALPEARLRGEVARTTGQLRMFADVIADGAYLEAIIDHAVPDATPPRPDLRRVLVPVGPVAVYAASNFPFAFSVAGGDTASALAVGCPVVVKAHPAHPELSRRTAAIVTEALAAEGAPAGVFGIVEGFEAGIELVEHPAIRAAAFTGSLAGGRALFDRAAARPSPIPFYGELGSINPVVITPAADTARGTELAAGLAASFQLGVGQFCTKPGVVLVPRGSVVEGSIASHLGPPGEMLSEGIASRFVEGVGVMSALPGVDVVAGAAAIAGGPIVLAADATTVLDRHEELLAEVFGPVTLLVRYDSVEEALRALSLIEGSLTTTIHAEPNDAIDTLVDSAAAQSGRVLFGGWPTGVTVGWAQQHGGPYPATTSLHTSVGATSVRRFQRPVTFQDAPEHVLPEVLLDRPSRYIPRRIDGALTS